MLTLLLVLNVVGFFGSSIKFKIGNPFQIYFFVWALVTFGYALTADTWIPVSSTFLLILISVTVLALITLATSIIPRSNLIEGRSLVRVNRRMACVVSLLQAGVILSVPFIYLRAVELGGGGSVFTIENYMRLRTALTEEGGGYGVWAYFFVLSYVVTTVTVFLYRFGFASLARLIVSIAISLFLTYLATGRTFVLLFMVMMIVPVVLDRVIGYRGVVVSIVVLASLFLFVAIMTAKGVSLSDGSSNNFESIEKNLRSYTIAPLIAFSTVLDAGQESSDGSNTFRFFLQLSNALGVTEFEVPSLIKKYAEVPDLTNVYTVYEAYFSDFSYFGLLVPPCFLILHFFLYKKALICGEGWVFVYSASVYPLVMQFFQDQYFSLLSTWLQIGFWCWLIFAFQGEIRVKAPHD